jgi:hypothetical protein
VPVEVDVQIDRHSAPDGRAGPARGGARTREIRAPAAFPGRSPGRPVGTPVHAGGSRPGRDSRSKKRHAAFLDISSPSPGLS